jgi:hypothetical protein
MTIYSIEAFVPSGADFEKSKQLFIELGFTINWEQQGLAGFEKDGCKFILQDYHVAGFAENLMFSVRIDDAEGFYKMVLDKQLPERFGVRVMKPQLQPYGLEVNFIDIAGVLWHFIQ